MLQRRQCPQRIDLPSWYTPGCPLPPIGLTGHPGTWACCPLSAVVQDHDVNFQDLGQKIWDTRMWGWGHREGLLTPLLPMRSHLQGSGGDEV